MRWKANPDVVVQRMGESLVLVNLSTDRILELNDTAATLFELVSSGLSQAELESAMAQRYEVAPEQIRDEMTSALDLLAQEQVVAVENA